jgi:hypothetical protein
MAIEERGRELAVARHGVVPGVRREVAVQIRVVAEQLVGDASAFDRA